TLITFLSIPLMVKSGFGLKKTFDSVEELVPYMSSTLMFSRITGALFVLSFIIGITV
ncbi:MAG: prenyltransferase, partial [Nitrosopumilus sp.]